MADDLEDRPAAATVVSTEPLGRGTFFRYERYHLTLDGVKIDRDTMRVGRVVLILPVDLERDEVVLIRQFRMGAQLALGLGDMIEIPGGRVEAGEELASAAARECQEEIGTAPRALVPIFDLMPSAGSTDEHMFFYLGLVDASQVADRAGAAHEQEDTRPLRVKVDRAIEAVRAGRMHYGAAVFALQWLALNRGRLAAIAAGR